jgi:hypothetical protein
VEVFLWIQRISNIPSLVSVGGGGAIRLLMIDLNGWLISLYHNYGGCTCHFVLGKFCFLKYSYSSYFWNLVIVGIRIILSEELSIVI